MKCDVVVDELDAGSGGWGWDGDADVASQQATVNSRV